MVKPLIIDRNEILTVNTGMLLVQDGVENFTLDHSSNDYIYDNAPGATIYLRESIGNTIADQTKGMHINIDPFSLLTTVQGFDSTGVIELSNFTSLDAIAKALYVLPGYGTVLGAELHGPIVMQFQGDYDVKLSQFHLDPLQLTPIPPPDPPPPQTPIPLPVATISTPTPTPTPAPPPMDANGAEVYRLYAAAFGRDPDAGGQAFWTAQLAGGNTVGAIAQGFVSSAEFQGDYGSLSISDFVSDLYQNILHRPGEQGGVQFWAGQLSAGMGQASVVVGFADSPENRMLTAAGTGN